MNKIKAIVLDVDGVIVGDKAGYNAPYPPAAVIDNLKQIRKSGIYIILCSAKPYYSVKKIVDDAHLNNIQTALAGGLLIDSTNNKVIKKHVIENNAAIELVKIFLEKNIYTEIYTNDNYYIQKSQQDNLTKLRNDTLLFKPIIVDNLVDQITRSEIIKIIPIARNYDGKKIIEEIFLNFNNKLMMGWGTQPTIKDHYFGNTTAYGVSKKQSVLEIVNLYGITAKEVLGVGDNLTDWDFIGICGYAGAMGNATQELKKLIQSKGKNGYVGKSVNENGVLDIFEYFGL